MAAERKAEAEAAAREAALRARIEAAERERAALRAKEEAARLGLPPDLVELGLELVKIPAGEFLYGDDKEKRRTGEYWLGKTPVTNAQYKAFVDATGHGKPEHWQGGGIPKGKERHPVVEVSWEDARAFCRWAGVRLPREEEWEKGARGTDGRAYPWGNQKPEQSLCNFDLNVKDTTPVGQYPKGASPYGLLDMAGNVWEWCEDAWGGDPARRVVRGGSWNKLEDDVRAANRNRGNTVNRSDGLGFRVALSPQL
jgi:formylglycine-generating enzyme required for sulfatase activity